MAHGLVFIAFVVAGLLVGIAVKWAAGTWLLALLASIVPLCSVIFLIWADRTGRMGLRRAASAVRATGAVEYPKRRDRLVGVTRPRPPVAASMAGAVDLSALKQPPPPSRRPPSAAPGGVEVTEANLEAEVLVRSSQVPVVVVLWSPRSDASVQLGDALAELWRPPTAASGRWRR